MKEIPKNKQYLDWRNFLKFFSEILIKGENSTGAAIAFWVPLLIAVFLLTVSDL